MFIITRRKQNETALFDQAIALLTPAGERLSINAEGFTIPAIFYRAQPEAAPRPTVLMFNGFDGSQEESCTSLGSRLWSVVLTLLPSKAQGSPQWSGNRNLVFATVGSMLVTPVVDYCATIPAIDVDRLGLLGLSFGGYLAPRAAAFEPRIGAVSAAAHSHIGAFVLMNAVVLDWLSEKLSRRRLLPPV